MNRRVSKLLRRAKASKFKKRQWNKMSHTERGKARKMLEAHYA